MRVNDPRKGWECTLPWPPAPKKRPRVTTNGTYMPKEYKEWKAAVAGDALSGPVGLVVEFHKEKIVLMAAEAPDITRFGQADIDNLLGGLMDAMQDSGKIQNDRQITAVQMRFAKE